MFTSGWITFELLVEKDDLYNTDYHLLNLEPTDKLERLILAYQKKRRIAQLCLQITAIIIVNRVG